MATGEPSLMQLLRVIAAGSTDAASGLLAATPELAHILKVAAGSPVLVGREIAYLASGRPALLGVNTYRGDAYRFQADLYRPLS